MFKDRFKVSLGIVTFLWSFVIYILTIAPTVSFWDCGEFIATSYTFAVPHPPGSPMYLIMGRIFSMIPFGKDIAFRVNMMSPIVSAAAVLFLYLIIILLIEEFRGKTQNINNKLIVYGGAFVGAMAFAFTDSHWFNAVEAEVYAMSTFFTAIVVWLILKWAESVDQKSHGEKYILFIAYMIGLAIGIHLLNLLALPFVALIIYFRLSTFNWKSFIGITALTGGIFVVIYLLIIKGAPKLAKIIDINPAAISFPLALLVIFGIIIAVFVFAGQFFENGSWRKWTQLIVTGLVLITIGYSSYEVIFIRSLKNPNIDENDPETVQAAVSYLEREQYGAYTVSRQARMEESPNGRKYSGTWDFFWNYQVKKMYIRYFNWQYIGRDDVNVNFQQLWAIPWIIGWLGMFFHFNRDSKRAFSVLALLFMTSFAIVLYLNQPDPQPRERDYSYVGSFFAFAIWIGIGSAALLDMLTERIKDAQTRQAASVALLTVLILLMPVNMLRANYAEHSRSGNFVASDYAYNLLNSCEKDGILFTNGDNDTFPLWYLQEVEKVRTDVRVVNLSLLNTPWYIKQLKHIEPSIPIRISDDEIERMSVIPWQKKEVRVAVPAELNPAGEIRWIIEPTYRNMALRVQDIMIWEILSAVKWQRPVYLAVTVSDDNKIGLDEYLSMEGLTMRIHPNKVKPIDEEMIYKNMVDVYRYRNLDNPEVYYEPNTMRLMQNYRTGFMQAALEFKRAGYKDKALKLLNYMSEKIPETVIPIGHKELNLQLGRIYFELGDSTQLLQRLSALEERPNLTVDDMFLLAQVYFFDLKDYQKTEAILLTAQSYNPDDSRFVSFLYQVYNESEQYEKALTLLDTWLEKTPADKQAQSMRRYLLQEIEQNSKRGH